MTKRLYIAYGSNLNLRQMAMRCPTAQLVGTGEVRDYELQFKGAPYGAFATICAKEGAAVPVAVWSLQNRDEKALDMRASRPVIISKRKSRCSWAIRQSSPWCIS